MYEGLLLGGLPQEGLGKAGVKVSSKVLIRAEAQNTFLLKLMDPQIFQCTGIWPQDPCVPASKLTAALNAQLAIPIKLEYSNGVVGKVFSPAGVSATVLNLHRGILNIFQLNLKNTQNVYELHEAGPHGVCKTHYTIREDEKTRQITVTKSKDLNNCHERVIKDIGLAYAETCAECQERRQSLTGTATYSYIMKPTAAGALISEATVEELHQFSLFNTITGAAQMKAKQTLNLLEVQNTPLSPISGLYMARGSLKYEFATEILQTPIQLLKINNAEAQIAEVLQHLATNNMAMAHEGAPLKFIQLVQLMRVATFECIQNIWNQHKTKPVYRRWILDTIPVVGTPASVRFLKEKFQADEFAIPELTQALLVGLHLATANPDTIHQTASLATHPKIKAIPVLREVIMLAYGSMIARHCAEDPTCSADLLKPIHDLAAQAISRAEISEITLALKVLGNAGHPASLKPIMKLLPGFVSAAASMPVRVQVDAILALRNIAKREPKLVQPVALQLFMDKTLHPEVRTVALIVLFETKPSVALMTTIANAVHKEADKHVASFTYSYIKSLTKSMAPDLKDVAAAANVAMRILCPKMDRLSYRFSTAYQLDLYLSPLMAGAAGTAFIINDAATILPRAFLAKARAYLAGAAADVLEVGFRTDGLQDAVQKPHPADQNADRITRIKSTMQAIKDWKSMSAKQPLGSVYVKLLGQEIAFANIDKSFIDHIIQQTAQVTRLYARELKEIVKSLQKGIAFQYAKPILATELRRIIPTTVGVPMELDFYTAVVASASINVKAIITSSLPEQLEATSLDQLMKTDFQLQAEARTSVSMQSFAVIGVNTALIQAAVMTRGKIRAVAPAKLAVKADLPKGHFKVEALPTSAPDHVADFSLETVAVARNIEDLPNEKVVSLVPAQPSQAESWLPTSIQKTFCGDGPTLERLEFEIDIGRNAAQKLVKEVSVLKSENQEENFILLKLGHVLGSGTTDRNYHSRLSRSLGSSSNSSSSSSSSNSTSSSRVSQGSGRPLGPSRIRRDKGVLQCMNMLKLGHVLGSGTTDRNYHSRLSHSLGSSSNSSSSSSSSNSTSSSRVSQGSIRPYGHSRIRRNKEVLQCMNMLKLGHVLDSGTTDRNYHSRLSRSLGSSSNSSSSSSSSNSTSSSRVSQGSIRPYGPSRIRRDKVVLQCMTMLKLGHVLGSGTTDRNYHSRLSRSLGSSSNSSSSSSSSISTSSSRVSQGSIRPYGHSRIRRVKEVLQCMNMLKQGHVLDSGTTDRNYYSRLSRSLGSSSNSSSSSSSSNSTISSRSSQGAVRPYGHSRIHRDKFLEDAIPPAFAIVARAVRSDRSVGYLIAGYLDRSTARSQIVISSIADQGKWKMCADGVLSSKHKLNAEVSWGKECQEYNVTFKAKAGIHDSNPALHFEVEWDRHPRLYLVTSYVKWISEYIPTSSQNTGLSIENTDNKKREVAVIVDLPTQRSLNIIVRAPQMTLTQMDVQLPVALPIEKDGRISALQNVDIQSTIKKLDSDFRARNRNATIETLQKLMQQLQKVGENVLDDMEAAERSSNTGN
ncbi:vitellogenin-like isoform X2 [Hoplias malabaricus]